MSLESRPTQEALLLAMLRTGPKTTQDFCQTSLAREYPRCVWTGAT